MGRAGEQAKAVYKINKIDYRRLTKHSHYTHESAIAIENKKSLKGPPYATLVPKSREQNK
jgi:hypothetical protein